MSGQPSRRPIGADPTLGTADPDDRFRLWYDAESPHLLRALLLDTGSTELALDLTVVAASHLLDHWIDGGSPLNPTGWAIQEGFRLLDTKPWRRRTTVSTSVQDLGPELGPLVATMHEVGREVRRATILHHLGGLDEFELAQALHSTPSQARALMSRGEAALEHRHL